MSNKQNDIWNENLEELETLPVKETDSPLVKRIKYENEVSQFIFDQLIKQ